MQGLVTQAHENDKRRPLMRVRHFIIPVSLLATLGACGAPAPSTTDRGFIADLSPEVAALAAPNQNLNAVQFRPENGCYWVQWDGPVETVMVPLRAASGGVVCTPSAAR
jgi:hypothetical protein